MQNIVQTLVDKISPSRLVQTALLTIMAFFILLGLYIEGQKGTRQFENLSTQTDLTISHLANNLIQISYQFNLASGIYENFQDALNNGLASSAFVSRIFLVNDSGTYFDSNSGNPTLDYFVSEDDTDHAADFKYLINKEYWRNYFLQKKQGSFSLHFDEEYSTSLLLALPIHGPTTIDFQLVVAELPIDVLLALPNNKLVVRLEKNQSLIWPSQDNIQSKSKSRNNDSFEYESFISQSSNLKLLAYSQANYFPYLFPLPFIVLVAWFLIASIKKISKKITPQSVSNVLCDELRLFTFETDNHGKVIWTNGELPAGFKIYDIKPGNYLNQALKDYPRYFTYFNHTLNGEKLTFEIEDNEHSLRIHQWPIISSRSEVTSIGFIVQEITDQRAIEFQLEHQQYHDDLTALPNRQLFIEQLQHEIYRAKRKNEYIAVLALKINGLNNVNKDHGHETGDELLRKFATKLKSILREEDTLCRFSSSEFLILYENYERPDELKSLSQKLITTAEEPIYINRQHLRLTSNVGIATFPKDARDTGSLISNAIAAMRHARQAKRNSYEYYSIDNTRIVQEKWQLEQAMTDAIKTRKFELHYQPIFDMKTGVCIGTEALLRWPSQELTPNEFIPLAEETGLIYSIGLWVLETAMAQLIQWKLISRKLKYISVNLSVLQLNHNTFLTDIEDLISRYPFSEGELVLEITESIMLKADDRTLGVLNKLRSYGFHLAIDDFGTGFSSLNYLKYLPVNILKIDRSFISEIPENENDVVICKAIIQMANAMKLVIIAEGVETPEQLKWLNTHNVYYSQGFFHARPVPPDVFERYLSI